MPFLLLRIPLVLIIIAIHYTFSAIISMIMNCQYLGMCFVRNGSLYTQNVGLEVFGYSLLKSHPLQRDRSYFISTVGRKKNVQFFFK